MAAFLRRSAAELQRCGLMWCFLIRPTMRPKSTRRRWVCWAATGLSCWRRDAVVIAEHRRKEKLEEHMVHCARTRLLEQGDAALSFYASSFELLADDSAPI